jgi:putative transposase
MPRTARASVGGVCYPVLNRGNNRRQVFRKEGDCDAFVRVLNQACADIPTHLLASCRRPNHFQRTRRL